MSKAGRKQRKFAKGYVLGPDQGVPGYDSDVKASRSSTGGRITVIESHTLGGEQEHVHTREDEYFYVLEGRIIVHCGDETYSAGPGSFVFLPRGIPHGWDVHGGGLAKILMMTAPAMLEEFLREFHAPTVEPRHAIAAKYGITFVRKPSGETKKLQGN